MPAVARSKLSYVHDSKRAASQKSSEHDKPRRRLSKGQKAKLRRAFLYHRKDLCAWNKERKGPMPTVPYAELASASKFGVFAEGGKRQVQAWWKRFTAKIRKTHPGLVCSPPPRYSQPSRSRALSLVAGGLGEHGGGDAGQRELRLANPRKRARELPEFVWCSHFLSCRGYGRFLLSQARYCSL
jgi:hypothetical protein